MMKLLHWDPFLTTGNDKWETDVPLDDIMGYGQFHRGIMLETYEQLFY